MGDRFFVDIFLCVTHCGLISQNVSAMTGSTKKLFTILIHIPDEFVSRVQSQHRLALELRP